MVPADELDIPNGWSPTQFDQNEVVFRHAETSLALRIDRIQYAPQVPDAEVQNRWEVSCEQEHESSTSSRFVACLATRPAAIYGLLAGMEQLNTLHNGAGDPLSVDEASDMLTIRDGVARATGNEEPFDGQVADEW